MSLWLGSWVSPAPGSFQFFLRLCTRRTAARHPYRLRTAKSCDTLAFLVLKANLNIALSRTLINVLRIEILHRLLFPSASVLGISQASIPFCASALRPVQATLLVLGLGAVRDSFAPPG